MKTLEKAIGIDVDAYLYGSWPTYSHKPGADNFLDVDAAFGFEQQPPPVATAEQGERRWGRPQHRDPITVRCGVTKIAGGGVDGNFVWP